MELNAPKVFVGAGVVEPGAAVVLPPKRPAPEALGRFPNNPPDAFPPAAPPAPPKLNPPPPPPLKRPGACPTVVDA